MIHISQNIYDNLEECSSSSGETYGAWIPGDVRQFGADFGDKVKHKNDQDNQRADHSPHGLPEDVGFVSNHELNVFVKPVKESRSDSGEVVIVKTQNNKNTFLLFYLPIHSIDVGYSSHLTEGDNEQRDGACVAVKEC